VASGVVIFIVFALIVADVFMRLLGIPPWTYIAAIVEYGLLWFTMLAAPWLVRVKGHVFIDAITVMLPPGAQRVLAKVAYILCICTTLMMAYYTFGLLVEAISEQQIDTMLIDVPRKFFERQGGY